MTVLLQALRTLRRSPGFLLLATASMSIGVGAAGALLAVIDAAFMRPLRYPSGERLVAIQPVRLENGKTFGLLPWPYFEAVRGATGLELVSYLTPAELEPVFDNVSSSWTGARVSPHAVTLLGIRPVLGRVLQATDFDAGGPDAVIISTELWKSRFGGDPGVLGRTLPCDARVVRIVGVFDLDAPLPAFPRPLAPMFLAPDRREASELMADGVLTPFARMRPGIEFGQITAELSTRLGVVAETHPQLVATAVMKLTRMRDYLYGDHQAVYQLLTCAASLTLLIVVVNLSNLVMARQRFRRRDLAVRASLGASSRALVVDLLVQNVGVACLAAPGSVFVAYVVCGLIGSRIPASLSLILVPELDGRVVGLICVLSLVMALLATIVSARSTWHCANPRALAPGVHAGASRRTAGSRVLIGGQAAMGIVLLVVAGLMINSVVRLARLEVGADVADVLVFKPSMPAGYTSAQTRAFWDAFLERVGADPLTRAAAAGFSAPMLQRDPWASIAGRDGTDWKVRGAVVPVTQHYFETLGIPLQEGRSLTIDEARTAAYVGVVNETAARMLWPDGRPVGRDLWTPWFPRPYRIVGVVADSRFSPSLESVPTVYVPVWHRYPVSMHLFLRTGRPEGSASVWLAQEARRLEPAIIAPAAQRYGDMVDKWYARPKFLASVLTLFAGLTLLSAAVGAAAVVGYGVALRHRELGIRIALGATRRRIHGLVLGEALLPTLAGLAIGLPAAASVARLLRAEVFGIGPFDPATYTIASLTLVVAVLAAAYLPARWASGVDAATTLRRD